MRKYILIVVSAVTLSVATPAAHAVETASQRVAQEDEASNVMKWKLINSAIFALLLGFAAVKYGPKFFNARSLDIQKAIKDASGLKIEADFRYSAIDKKMANLSGEVGRMKAEAAAEMDREHNRVLEETRDEIEHIGRHADVEIESLREDGALAVKRHTAQLALGLAEHRLQAHYAQNDEQNNVGEFVSLVGGRK